MRTHLLCVDGLMIALQDLFFSHCSLSVCFMHVEVVLPCQLCANRKMKVTIFEGKILDTVVFFKVGRVFYSKWFLT